MNTFAAPTFPSFAPAAAPTRRVPRATLLRAMALNTPAAWDYVIATCANQPADREHLLLALSCGPRATSAVATA